MQKNPSQKSLIKYTKSTKQAKQPKLTVLSLFDGISCGQYVLRKKLGINNMAYYASEIEQHTIKNTMHNFPDTIQLGDITKIDPAKLPVIDLLLGGSPCQGFSSSGHGHAFNDPRSKLFFEYVRFYKALRRRNPNIKFLLENVVMATVHKNVISKYMEVEPIYIDSALFSAQSRKRLYWTNIPMASLSEKNSPLCIQDILNQPYYVGSFIQSRDYHKKGFSEHSRVNNIYSKSVTLMKSNNVLNIPLSYHESRKGTCIEQERLMGLPDNYTLNLGGKTKRRESLGNAWECNTIAFILNYFNQK